MKCGIKRWLSLVLILAMVVSMLPPVEVRAEEEVQDISVSETVMEEQKSVPTLKESSGDVVDSGTCGENLTWKLDSNGTLTISGTGPMKDGSYNKSLWPDPDAVKNVIIEFGATSIGSGAFTGCSNLCSIYIPEGVTTIRYSAFAGCSSLISINIPEGVTSIGSSAFGGCSSLTRITIPESVTDIDFSAFEGCNSLISINIPKSVSYIRDGTFDGCSSLSSIAIPESVTYIGDCAFQDCSNMTQISLPKGVTHIGWRAFDNCSRLTGITIPQGVTIIGGSIFEDCSSLTSITIPEGVTSIGTSAFQNCSSLTSITIPESVTFIYERAFEGCSSLNSISIPEGVNSIGHIAFQQCYNLTSIALPRSLIKIDWDAFRYCRSLSDVYYAGTAEEWNAIEIDADNDELLSATIHFNSEPINPGSSIYSIPGLTLNTFGEDTFYLFMGDPSIYCMSAPDALTHLELKYTLSWETGYNPANITWSSSDESIVKVVWEDTTAELPGFIGLKTGAVTITATNPQGDSFSFELTVVKPNAVEMTNVYDTMYFHSGGAFYSAASFLSDSMEIFLQFDNKPVEKYPCKVQEDQKENLIVEPITLTATVSGNDLSFDRNSYQNTYTATYDAIAYESSVYDLLTLFPMDIENFCPESANYTVIVTLESEAFETQQTETYNFTVIDAETMLVQEHIDFIESNPTYNVFKQNIYGKNMITQKDDVEYIWSKWSTFDFDNYYEIVVADLLLGMLDSPQAEMSLVPTLLKEWYGNYKSILGSVETIVSDSYENVTKIPEWKVDKLLKASKYADLEVCKKDELFVAITDVFGNTEKFQSVFEKIDDTKQAWGIIKTTNNVVQDFFDWGNTISLLNAFKASDDDMKEMFQLLADIIPDSEHKMKEAIEDYVNYSHDVKGQAQELYEAFKNFRKDVFEDVAEGLGVFDMLGKWISKKSWDFLVPKVVGWIGNISVNGVQFSTTATFQTIAATSAQAIGGAVLTGVSLGLCVSDLICNSGDKAAEMGKLIAMSEYAPYIIQVLEGYERNIYTQKTERSVTMYENAFKLHQAAQTYIIDHTILALKAKADSILQGILGNEEYYRVAANAVANKWAIKRLKCHGTWDLDSEVVSTKLIAVKCPVDVYLYDETNNEVLRIRNNELEYADDEFVVYIRDGEKFIAMPDNIEYSVKIVATDAGSMDYQVLEYDENLAIEKELVKNDIPLVKDDVFTGEIPLTNNAAPDDYALSTGGSTFVPKEPEPTHSHTWMDANCTSPKMCTTCGATEGSALGHTKITIEGKDATCTEAGLSEGEKCSVCGVMIVEQMEIPATGHHYLDGKCSCGEKDPDYRKPVKGVTRLAGSSRYETSFAIANEMKKALGITKFDSIILANSDNFADALAGSYLAAVKQAPIIIGKLKYAGIACDYVNQNLKNGGTVYVLGGEGAVPAAMLTGITVTKDFQRLAGENRYDTNLAILGEAGVSGKDILVATGQDFADSLSASATGLPILLVNGKPGKTLSDAQKAFLAGVTGKIYIIGGESAVPNSMVDQIEAASGKTTERIAGNSRYETSVKIAQKFLPDAESAVVAYASTFPDGLCGGPLAYTVKAPLILTKDGKSEAPDYTKANAITAGYVLGGDGLISDGFAKQIFQVTDIMK